MRKTFMGVRLKTLREQRGLTQAALAQLLQLSPSYLNQLENNQRPLSVPVLLRLQGSLGVDLQFFSEDEEARLIAQVRDLLAESGAAGSVPRAELQMLAQQMPAMAAVLMRLHQRCRSAEERVAAMAAGFGDDRGAGLPAASLQPHEEVRDFFYAHRNHMADLDAQAEALFERLQQHAGDDDNAPAAPKPSRRVAPAGAGAGVDLAAKLEVHLARQHGVVTTMLPPSPGESDDETVWRFEPATRTLRLSAAAEPGQRAFQLATQLAHLEAAAVIDRLSDEARFSSAEARALARIGLAGYFAGAVVLPYRRFLAEAEALRYDIERLATRFGVSFETVCHRLSTLQRPDAPGVPFFFVRVDRAGNMSKRQSATDFHFSRTGGTCPLWNVYEAFAQPGRVLTQLARMPDGRTYLWVARCVSRQSGGYGSPTRSFAIGLGCDVRHAERLVYAKGLDLQDPEAATPIGAGCKVCDRQGCAQRAFPALGRPLRIDENERRREPYGSL